MNYYIFNVTLSSGHQENNIVVAAPTYEAALRFLYFGESSPKIDKANLVGTARREPKTYTRYFRIAEVLRECELNPISLDTIAYAEKRNYFKVGK